MLRRRSSSDRLPQLRFGDLQNLEQIFSISAGPTPAGAAFTAMVRIPNGSVSKPVAFSSSAMRAYSICCAAREFQDHRHQQPLQLDRARLPLLQHLFEQDALVRDVLVDDPQPSLPAAMMKLRESGRAAADRSASASIAAARLSRGILPCVSGMRSRDAASAGRFRDGSDRRAAE